MVEGLCKMSNKGITSFDIGLILLSILIEIFVPTLHDRKKDEFMGLG